jgi:hypothetical protein
MCYASSVFHHHAAIVESEEACMATDVTRNIRQALEELESQRNRIDEQIRALRQALTLANGLAAKPAARPAGKSSLGKRRGMSLKARQVARERMKAYWAKRRAAMAKKAKAE